MKKTQLIMVWFLPLIVIGGLFYPLLGVSGGGDDGGVFDIGVFQGQVLVLEFMPDGIAAG